MSYTAKQWVEERQIVMDVRQLARPGDILVIGDKRFELNFLINSDAVGAYMIPVDAEGQAFKGSAHFRDSRGVALFRDLKDLYAAVDSGDFTDNC